MNSDMISSFRNECNGLEISKSYLFFLGNKKSRSRKNEAGIEKNKVIKHPGSYFSAQPLLPTS